MLQNYNKWSVLKVFFDDPLPKGGGFQLREISRKVKIAPNSVKRYLNELEKEGLIIKSKHRIHNYPIYLSNRDGEKFRFFKKIDMIILLEESGLLEYLQKKCMPDTIILFGSSSRGEDLKNSDIDLFLLCKERKLDLRMYEENLNRLISLHFNENFNSMSKELRNNILNGAILKGYIKVF
ncbi:MAG: nucleotidyltransferase domain-containing protein [Candidatus Aenigmarchaeota archaeon]|nr:nucleotidyltransferase domain-containing protein [Candidatus Aenigmarchaeota archaeon]